MERRWEEERTAGEGSRPNAGSMRTGVSISLVETAI